MIGALPALDVHAHLNENEGAPSGTIVVAVTNSLDATRRPVPDPRVIRAVGTHPADTRALEAFDPKRFAETIEDVAVIGEVGLDGRFANTRARQRDVFSAVLHAAQGRPRILSIHSVRAQAPVLNELSATPTVGAVLHWWTGTGAQTERAARLGCWFSVNAAQASRAALLQALPRDRVLTETDHPFGHGKRRSVGRPGDTSVIEAALADVWGCDAWTVRRTVWRNFAEIVAATSTGPLLPPHAQRAVLAIG